MVRIKRKDEESGEGRGKKQAHTEMLLEHVRAKDVGSMVDVRCVVVGVRPVRLIRSTGVAVREVISADESARRINMSLWNDDATGVVVLDIKRNVKIDPGKRVFVEVDHAKVAMFRGKKGIVKGWKGTVLKVKGHIVEVDFSRPTTYVACERCGLGVKQGCRICGLRGGIASARVSAWRKMVRESKERFLEMEVKSSSR